MSTTDTTVPIVSLTSSTSTPLVSAGEVSFTANASDDVGVKSVEIFKDGVSVALFYPEPCVYKHSFDIDENGNHSLVAVVTDTSGNKTTGEPVSVVVNIPPPVIYDTFANVSSGASIANATWDVSLHTWTTKTYLVGDGAGAVKVDATMPNTVAANWLSLSGDVGQAVFFKITGARSSTGNLLSICIDGAGGVPSHYQVDGMEVLLNGGNLLYLKDNKATGAVSASYDIAANTEYCLEICKTADSSGKVYNARLSNSSRGVRGSVIATQSMTIGTARTEADTVVQLRTSAVNKDIIRITRVEALTKPFDVPVTATSTGGTTGSTTKPALIPYLFSETGTAIQGPTGLAVKFGPAGAPVPVTIVEKLYSGLSVGFGSVTQSCWMTKPITVNGIQFVLFLLLDSNGRTEVRVYGAFAAAASQSLVNKEHAAVDLQITVNGVAKDLFGAGTTYSYNHQRCTWLRWESAPMPWNTSQTHLNKLIADGTFMQHDDHNLPGSTRGYLTSVDTNPLYKPFKEFSSRQSSMGGPQWKQYIFVGDSYRGSSAGGERTTIGPCHEWMAQLINEVSTGNNPDWVTAERLKTLQYVSESVAQYPHTSGLLYPADKRLIDPSEVPFSTHRNYVAWGPCIGIPQGGVTQDPVEGYFDFMYDAAHPSNKVSYHAYFLSKDPWHLFQVQAQAITAIAYCTGSKRGADGKILRVTVEEERGFWWGLQTLIHAWKATPEGTLPAPFRDKAFFTLAIENTLQYIRDQYMGTTCLAYTGVAGEAAKFWRTLAPYELQPYPGEIFWSTFMGDYGHIVLAEALLAGYTGARDVAEWHAFNIQLRLECGGNWYLADKVVAGNAGLGQAIAKKTDSHLPYTDAASFKAWYPRQNQGYVNGNLIPENWSITSGRDTYQFMGVLNLYKELQRRKLITIGFNAAAAETEFRNRHLPSEKHQGYVAWSKASFGYKTVTA